MIQARLFKQINKTNLSTLILILCLCYVQNVRSETYTLSVGESVNISQTPYNGGYIDNVGLADFLDPHLGFQKNYDGSAKITVNSYFNYTVTVKLVFIERYTSYYGGRNHTLAATYYKDVTIKCNYTTPSQSSTVTKVVLPERFRVTINSGYAYLTPTYEPYGAKPAASDVSWSKSQGTAIFTLTQSGDDGSCRIMGRSPGVGNAWVRLYGNFDNPNMYAETIIEVVDPNFLPPNNVFLPSSIEISVGSHNTLNPTLIPENTSTSYTWSSSDESVATVSYGKVIGKKVGTSTITVKTANALKATCTVIVVNTNGKDDEDDDGGSTSGTIGGHDYVDLGLSVKWATCNVGSSSPEGFGGYYAWGETSEKSSYSWGNYQHCGGSMMNVYDIGSNISGTNYDAAYVNWGSDWRMPTEIEMGELVSKCSFAKHTSNGVDGYLVTGPNGNSIFFPIAGAKGATSNTGCRYWTSNVHKEWEEDGMSLFVTTNNANIVSPSVTTQYRYYGLPIRAVTQSQGSSDVNPTSISVSPASKTIKVGETFTPSYTLTPSNATTTVTWSSDNSSIASVNSSTGLVTGVKAGTTYINATTANGKQAWCKVTVENGDIAINSTNFPDANFRNYLLKQSYGADGVITQAEINGITILKVSIKNISSLKGIEYFTALKDLDCFYNELTSLDVSKNTALEYLNCSSNELTSLDVSKNTKLKKLYCYSNELTSLDVSKNTALEELSCSFNELTSLDVSKNTALKILQCCNDLTSLDVSKNTALEHLDCSYSDLTNLDVSKNTALKELYCFYNELTSLDFSKNTALEVLLCYSNELTSLDFSKNTKLKELYCFSNELTSLDVSKNTKLKKLYCSSNELTSLDVSKNTALEHLACSSNELTSLDVSKNTALEHLDCSANYLTSLDVSSKNTALEHLDCYGNQIKGTSMDALISSLPRNTTNEEYKLRILTNSSTEGNICTKAQVSVIKAKGWTPYYYDGSWKEYEGSDGESGIDAIYTDKNGKNVIYTIDGVRLNTTHISDLPKGIYIVNGKKVVMK